MKYVFYISKSMPDRWTTYRRDTEKRNGDAWHLPKGDEPAEPFDVPRILAKLKGDLELREKSEGRCQFRQVRIDGHEIAAICAMTDYPHARTVALALGKLLYDEPDVSLYDAERDMEAVSSKSDVPKENFITARLAYRKYRTAIIKQFFPQRRYAARIGYFKIEEDYTGWWSRVTVSVTALRGDFRELVRIFDSILKGVACELGDEVSCANGCFSVWRKDVFRFQYNLEGVGKSPEWIGWMEGGKPKIEKLKRCGIWRTRKAIAMMPRGELEHIRSRLHYGEELVAGSIERNLADRFVNSYKLSKLIARHGLDIVYGKRPDDPHSEVAFWLSYDGAWYDPVMDLSTIRFGDEDKASVILDLIGEIIPSYWEHYYEEFYVRAEEVQRVMDRMKEVREIVRRNPTDLALGRLADRLMCSSFAWDHDESAEPEYYDEAKKKSLIKHRHDIVALYDIFIRWMDYASHDGFFVVGP